jgi:hypothetical protein
MYPEAPPPRRSGARSLASDWPSTGRHFDASTAAVSASLDAINKADAADVAMGDSA